MSVRKNPMLSSAQNPDFLEASTGTMEANRRTKVPE
jgi:hypothetical protein